MNLQHLLIRKARGQRVADGDHFVQISVDGELHLGQITDVEAMSARLEDGRDQYDVRVLVRYPVAGGDRYAQLTHTCVAPADCTVDWNQVLCAWTVEQLVDA